jgi:hypothetical protein
VSTPGKPDLDRLVTALTADAQPDELTGREAAVRAFRAANRHNAVNGATRQRRVPFRPFTYLRPQLAAIGAVVVVVAGVAAAAYTQSLPGPAQNVAHTVFAPLGVPGHQQAGPPAAVTISSSGAKSGRGDGYLLTAKASRARVPAGTAVVLTGRVTDHGRPVAEAPVQLFERVAGSATWQLVASGVTGPYGGFRLESPPLAQTVVFRVVGPERVHSGPVKVTVPRSSLRSGS